MGTSTQYPVKRLAIIGANGQLGSLIHQYLLARFPETQILACVRRWPTCENVEKKGYILFHPFTDNWQLLGKVDVLINCVGIIEESKNTTFEQAHVELTKLILKNRPSIGNPKIIQISALGANSNSSISFLSTKGKADELVLVSENTVMIRPSIVCTPNTMLVQKLKLLKRIARCFFNYLPIPDHLLQTHIQPIMPEDLAELIAIVCITTNHPAIIPAVGPHSITIEELILQSSNRKVHLLKIPPVISSILVHTSFMILPKLVSKTQYQLLQQDNTGSTSIAENLLNRKLLPTNNFWKNQVTF